MCVCVCVCVCVCERERDIETVYIIIIIIIITIYCYDYCYWYLDYDDRFSEVALLFLPPSTLALYYRLQEIEINTGVATSGERSVSCFIKMR